LRDDGSVKVSRSIKYNAIQIKNFIAKYQSEKGNEPSIDEIAKEFNLEPQDVVFTLEASTQLMSIDEKFDDEDDSLAERTQDTFSPDKLIDKLVIRDMIDSLPAREKRIVIMRYYLDKTQTEIASSLGVSQVQISRIENKILQNFKEMIK